MKRNAEETLEYMIGILLIYLEELSAAKNPDDSFLYGERTAYIECLEWLQEWEYAKENGLDFEIEKKYPL